MSNDTPRKPPYGTLRYILRPDELNLDEWKLLSEAWEKHKDTAFESECGTWRRIEQCGLVMILLPSPTYDRRLIPVEHRAEAPPYDPCFVSITPAGETALSDRSSWLHDPTTGTANDRHAVAAEVLLKDGWRFTGRVAPLHLLFETMSQLLAAREEIAALRAGNTAQVIVDSVVASALDAAKKEAERERVRWQQAAARSDAERQRRQNSVRGKVVGISPFNDGTNGLIVHLPTGLQKAWESLADMAVWLVVATEPDDETLVPKNEEGS